MDVISVPIEYDEEKIDSPFRLVEAVAIRARQLCNGAMPRIASNAAKLTTVALQEVLSGSVDLLSGEDAAKAKEKAEKGMMDEAGQRASLAEEELTEIERDLKVYLQKKGGIDNEETSEKISPEKDS